MRTFLQGICKIRFAAKFSGLGSFDIRLILLYARYFAPQVFQKSRITYATPSALKHSANSERSCGYARLLQSIKCVMPHLSLLILDYVHYMIKSLTKYLSFGQDMRNPGKHSFSHVEKEIGSRH